MFKGKPVTYQEPRDGIGKPIPVIKNFDGSVTRVWMPNGAPPYTTQTEAEPEKYQDPAVMEQWKVVVETGKFAGGVMPEVPPKREFCMWDF
jgi:nucleoporin NUP42